MEEVKTKKRTILAVITGKGAAGTIRKIQRLEKDKGTDVVIIAFDRNARERLKEACLQYKTMEDYLKLVKVQWEEQFETAVQLVKKWQDVETNEGKSVNKLLTYLPVPRQTGNGISLYEVVMPELAIYSMSQIVKNIDLAKCVVEVETPDEIIVSSRNDLLSKSFIAVGKSHNISSSIIQRRFISSAIRYVITHTKTLLRQGRDITKIVEYQARKRDFLVEDKEGSERCKTKNRKIVFFNLVAGHVRSVIPIAKRLLQEPANDVLVVSDRKSMVREKLRAENISFRIFEGYARKISSWQIARESRLLKKNWKYLAGDENFTNALTYQKVSIWELGKESFAKLFPLRFDQIIKIIETVKCALLEEQPGIVITTSDVGIWPKIWFLVAKNMNIPTLHVEWATVSSHAPDWAFMSADKATVSGEYSKRTVIHKRGIDSNRLVVTGQPRYDGLIRKRESKEVICRRYSLDTGKRIILFTSIPYYEGVPSEEGGLSKEEHHEWLHAIYQASKEIDNAQLVVKPHPHHRDPYENHSSVLREVGNESSIVIAPKDSDVLDLISVCDVMITWLSTTALEAMILNKPVIIVNLTSRTISITSYNSEATLEVFKKEDIALAIKDALDNSEVRERLISAGRKCVQDRLYIMDGKASQRIANLIVDMIDAKNSQI